MGAIQISLRQRLVSGRRAAALAAAGSVMGTGAAAHAAVVPQSGPPISGVKFVNLGGNPGSASGTPNLVSPGDTFDIDITAFGTVDSAYAVGPLTATFGATQTFTNATLDGETVTVASSESVTPTTTTDTVTISAPTAFLPSGATFSDGTAITSEQVDLGGNAGTNGLDLALPINPTTLSGLGSFAYNGGTGAFAFTPAIDATDTDLTGALGLNAGGGDVTQFGLNSFSLAFTYGTTAVPEPTSVAGLLAGGSLLARRRRGTARA